ncbi:MAG: mechanosensitive ion channel family protein [Deltaproteobacteria bacterium]|nr:mechanosensitive ion channel family protein [Deltaproteobacteria bacterium]
MQFDPSRLTEVMPYLFTALRVPAIVLAALILTRILKAVAGRLRREAMQRMQPRFQGAELELEKRVGTLGSILHKTSVTVLWIFAAIMALKELGFEIGPILAGAGVAGLAVGFGAQNLVRDVISGLFLIAENQIRVGDVAVVNGTGGLVEEVNLRTTALRGVDGTVHVFPNGSINTLSNMTREYSFYVFNLGVAYKEDTDQVVRALVEVSAVLQQEPEFAALIREPLEVLGVDAFGDSAVVIKARIKTEPGKQWAVGRELNRRFKKRFDAEGIEIPFPQRTVHFGDTGGPEPLGQTLAAREWVRGIVREVVSELAPAPGRSEGRGGDAP